MATLIDWNQLLTRVNTYKGLYEVDTDRAAFPRVVLEAVLNLPQEEVEDAITDGGRDRGIDAVYVDDRDGRNTAHFFNFKFTDRFENSSNNFPGGEIDKILTILADIFNRSQTLKDECNPILWDKVQETWSALDQPNFNFEVHLCSNMSALAAPERARLDAALRQYRHFKIHEHTLETIVVDLIERQRRRIDKSIQVVDDQYFERSDGDIRGLIATVPATEIVAMVTDGANPPEIVPDIFNDNIRIYLGSANPVNRRIIESAASDENARFWYLNNGITVTCDTMAYPPRSRSPRVAMTNVQIVNGGQTSHALYEVSKRNPEQLRNVLVLLRIYETRQASISSKIAEATNSQTPIKGRDLRSNDFVQKQLEQSFLDIDYYYERKANQYLDRPRDRRIDSLSAGQAYLAYFFKMPEVARRERGRVFGDLYDMIFSDDITATKMLVAWRLLRNLDSKKSELRRRLRRGEPYDRTDIMLIDGTYHILFTIAELCDRSDIDKANFGSARAVVDRAISVVKSAVAHEQAADPAFAFTRFFKDSKTKVKLQRQIDSEEAAVVAG